MNPFNTCLNLIFKVSQEKNKKSLFFEIATGGAVSYPIDKELYIAYSYSANEDLFTQTLLTAIDEKDKRQSRITEAANLLQLANAIPIGWFSSHIGAIDKENLKNIRQERESQILKSYIIRKHVSELFPLNNAINVDPLSLSTLVTIPSRLSFLINMLIIQSAWAILCNFSLTNEKRSELSRSLLTSLIGLLTKIYNTKNPLLKAYVTEEFRYGFIFDQIKILWLHSEDVKNAIFSLVEKITRKEYVAEVQDFSEIFDIIDPKAETALEKLILGRKGLFNLDFKEQEIVKNLDKNLIIILNMTEQTGIMDIIELLAKLREIISKSQRSSVQIDMIINYTPLTMINRVILDFIINDLYRSDWKNFTKEHGFSVNVKFNLSGTRSSILTLTPIFSVLDEYKDLDKKPLIIWVSQGAILPVIMAVEGKKLLEEKGFHVIYHVWIQ